MDAARYSEALETLDRLIRGDPAFYQAYPKRWAAMGKLKTPEAVKTEIRKDMALLEQVPPRKRNDELFLALIAACDWLGDAACKETWRQEAIAGLPRGRVERAARLEAAWMDKDPVRSVALFDGILRDFPDDSKVISNAARGRMEAMSAFPDRFTTASLVEAAELLEKLVSVRPVPDDDPHEYPRAMLQISKILAERSPARALGSAARGVGFVERIWPTTGEVRQEERYLFWPVMIRAYGAMGDWSAARRVCESLLETFDAARIPGLLLPAIDEAAVRRDCGRVLEKTDSVDEARMQLGVAAAIDSRFKEDVIAFSGRHPLTGVRAKKFQTALAVAEKRLRVRRDSQVKGELLAAEESRPAPGFVLKDLDGRTVSLRDFRGRTLVLSFWATWCGPCIGEIKELETACRKYRHNPRIAFAAVSIDTDTGRIPGFVKAHGMTFPVLLSDGAVEASYGLDGVPVLYVIDAAGRIRFLRDGWVDDGYGLKRIDWMIEAVLRDPLPARPPASR